MSKKRWIGIGVLIFASAGYSSDEILVTHGPSTGYNAQVEYLRKTSPKQFGIVVIEIAGSLKCFIPKGPTDSGNIEYCNVDVVLKDTIAVVWLRSDPKSPDDRFQIHYWYPKDQKPKMISQGERLIVFLVPSHFQETYVCTVIVKGYGQSSWRLARGAMATLLRDHHLT